MPGLSGAAGLMEATSNAGPAAGTGLDEPFWPGTVCAAKPEDINNRSDT
jgi:hypothetical protein